MMNPHKVQQVTFATRILNAMDAQKHRLRGNVKQADKALAEMTKMPRDRLRAILTGEPVTLSEFNRLARALPALLTYRDEALPPSAGIVPLPPEAQKLAHDTRTPPARMAEMLAGAPLTNDEVQRLAPALTQAKALERFAVDMGAQVTITPRPRAPGDRFVTFDATLTPAPETAPMPATLTLVPPAPADEAPGDAPPAPPPKAAPAVPAPMPDHPQLRPRTFGQWLRAHREEADAQQGHVADILGVDSSTVSGWELDHSFPTPENHKKLLALFPGLAKAPVPRATRNAPDRPSLARIPPAKAASPASEARPSEPDAQTLVRYGVRVSRALEKVDAHCGTAVLDLLIEGMAQGLPLELAIGTVRDALVGRPA